MKMVADILCTKTSLKINFTWEKLIKPHYSHYNDNALILNKSNSLTCREFLKCQNLLVFCLPACLPAIRPTNTRHMGPVFSHNKDNHCVSKNLLDQRSFIFSTMSTGKFPVHQPVTVRIMSAKSAPTNGETSALHTLPGWLPFRKRCNKMFTKCNRRTHWFLRGHTSKWGITNTVTNHINIHSSVTHVIELWLL